MVTTAEVIRWLEKVASDMITWFTLNKMKVNENKFQLIIFNGQWQKMYRYMSTVIL